MENQRGQLAYKQTDSVPCPLQSCRGCHGSAGDLYSEAFVFSMFLWIPDNLSDTVYRGIRSTVDRSRLLSLDANLGLKEKGTALVNFYESKTAFRQ